MQLKLVKIDSKDPSSGYRVYDGVLYMGAIEAGEAQGVADSVNIQEMAAEQESKDRRELDGLFEGCTPDDFPTAPTQYEKHERDC